jgi:ABC-type transport system involved in multi-copper enzyme maturation permease subunit
MRNIALLIRKDLWQQRRFVPALLAIELAGGLVMLAQLRGRGVVPAAVSLAVLLLLGYVGPFMICYRTMLAEEKNRAFLLLKTLPIDNRQLVLAKFAANFLLSAANLLVMFLYYEVAGGLFFDAGAMIELSPSFVYFTTASVLGASAFFVGVALVFESERVAWFLLPLVWVVASAVASWSAIVRSLHAERVAAYLGAHFNVVSTALVVVVALMVGATEILFDRRKSFG